LAQKAIDDIVRVTSKSMSGIVEGARNRTTAQIYKDSYTKELAQIADLSGQVQEELAGNVGNAPLSALLARLKFLEFERKFAGLFDAKDLDAAGGLAVAFVEELEALAGRMAAEPDHSDVADVRGTIELAAYAEILLRFRAFSMAFPEVTKNAPREPTPARLDELQQFKEKSIEVRRKNNRLLSVDYIVFKKVVEDVDSHDIALVNAWREFLQNKK
jgi:hypothetical protein